MLALQNIPSMCEYEVNMFLALFDIHENITHFMIWNLEFLLNFYIFFYSLEANSPFNFIETFLKWFIRGVRKTRKEGATEKLSYRNALDKIHG